jgi:hypothetical protein
VNFEGERAKLVLVFVFIFSGIQLDKKGSEPSLIAITETQMELSLYMTSQIVKVLIILPTGMMK